MKRFPMWLGLRSRSGAEHAASKPAVNAENASLVVLRGFLAMSANSAWLMALQLGYASLTSRLLDPEAFGNYAVALVGVGLVGMVGGSSMELAAARRPGESAHLDRALLVSAAIVGCAALIVTLLLAGTWARLWDAPGSTTVSMVLAVSLPFVALQGVFAGILRRKGRTAALAMIAALAQTLAMALGLCAVLMIREAWTLAVSPVAASFLLTLALASRLPGTWRQPTFPGSGSIPDLSFSAKAASLNLLRYTSRSFAVWSIGRFAGTDALGAYNRATTLTTVPLDGLQRSFTYSLYPEMRPGGPVDRSKTALNDVMLLVSTAAIVLAGTGYFVAPVVVEVLLGPGWQQAVALAGPAVLLGVIPMVSAPLGNALEAQGRFAPTVRSWAISTVPIAIGVLLTYQWRSTLPAITGLIVAGLASIPVLAVPLQRQGALRARSVLTGLRMVFAIQLLTSVALLIIANVASENVPLKVLAMALVIICEGAFLWQTRKGNPAFRVLQSRLG